MRRPGGSKLDLAVRLDLFAGLENALHDVLGISALGELHDHLLGHEIHGRVGDAIGLLCGLLHQVRAVCAVNFVGYVFFMIKTS